METTTPARILVVDDDPGLRDLLRRYLEEQGYEVVAVRDGVEMDRALADAAFDLLILDVMLPGEDGLSLLRRTVSRQALPVIMVSARGEDVDRIVGLEVGADDYIAKPFNPRELLARVRAVLRRHSAATEDEASGEPEGIYRFGPFEMHVASQRLLRNGEEVPLTTGEFTLLRVLTEHPQRVLDRNTLLDLIKGYEHQPFDRSIDVRVARLRRKIEDDASHPRYIRTVWGRGYLFAPDGNEVSE
ncbi:two component transcriptional regulator, winged helix family [Thioalkalivibrio nitratireducens DSM 14787]|uniref:Two component transcriptional regulator, winged helix family n=1 Tax=Thioalkalivibrio nitratireducens (strain DSM 14787 / UNIQEM 213 / ALEN2) TaxID=1255043 RepID=L0DU29_THIND|nr:response regulator [Thioalkalivibrio nitratireducens]AGA32495.1 two component transcriptional regulator, winged helix family [Thioalkalivibrio nitratireducens DSM 14787]